VYAIGATDSTLFAGGSFFSVGGEPRYNLAALDLATGRPTSWAPTPSGDVRALAASGSTIYAGGNFQFINGVARGSLAALDAVTGLLIPWAPVLGGRLYPTIDVLAIRDTTVYVAGSFNGSLAALGAGSGLSTGWFPAAGPTVDALALSGSTVFVGGSFTSIGGRGRSGLAELDLATGLATPWNPSPNGLVRSLALSGPTLYVGGGFTMIGGEVRSYIAALDTATGQASAWAPDANNAVTALAASGTTIYAGGDFSTIGGQTRIAFAALDRATGLAEAWDPGLRRSVRTLATHGTMVYVGSATWQDWNGNTIPGIVGVTAASGPFAPPIVTVLQPSGGDTLEIGSSRSLQWNATADGPGVQFVDLYLSRAGPAGPWERIVARASNTGHYTWTVTAPASDDCYLRVDAHDYADGIGSDVGDAAFVIVQPAVPTVIRSFRVSPIGNGVRIAWRLSGPQSPDVATVARTGSLAGGNWVPVVGTAACAADSCVLIDPAVPAGRWWYRLSIVTQQGQNLDSSPAVIDVPEPVLEYALLPLAPNPSEGDGVVWYALPHRGHVRLSLSDLQGREVAVLVEGVRDPGRQSAALGARGLPPGVYLLRLRVPGVDLTRRVVILR
jgi:hypothetical protein